MRLWTFQHNSVANRLRRGVEHIPSWEATPANFRIAYQWMAKRLNQSRDIETSTPPVWCWHSCGELCSPPTVGTAAALLSEHDIAQGMVTIELAVPPSQVLLSSYGEWNLFLGDCLEQVGIPEPNVEWQNMFQVPPITRDSDDIQAVLTRIDPIWVKAMSPLILRGRDRAEALVAS